MTDVVSITRGHGPEGRIAIVTFDRMDNINALSPAAMRALTDAARSIAWRTHSTIWRATWTETSSHWPA